MEMIHVITVNQVFQREACLASSARGRQRGLVPIVLYEAAPPTLASTTGAASANCGRWATSRAQEGA